VKVPFGPIPIPKAFPKESQASPITGNNNGRQAKQKAIKKGALLKIQKEKETGENEILAAKFPLFIVPRRVNYTT